MKDQIDANMQGVMIKTVRQARRCKAPSTWLQLYYFLDHSYKMSSCHRMWEYKVECMKE